MQITLLLTPPIVFILLMLLLLALSGGLAKFAAKSNGGERLLKPYIYNPDQSEQQIIAGYSGLLPVAFSFAIIQVVVLVVATTPANTLLLPLLYVAGGIMALVIIFRR